jgi:hypothetical protein
MATKEQIQDLINQIGNETRPGQNTATRIATVLNDINWSDTLFYANLSSFPVTGEIEKIYIDESTNLMYIWNANTSQYSPIGGSSSSGSGSTSGAEVISLTYSELITLVNGNTLVPGQKYLINDYQTVHLIPNTAPIQPKAYSVVSIDSVSIEPRLVTVASGDINTGPIEPLLVTASSTKTLEPIAYSTLFPQDIIYYNIESDQNIVSGSTKGYIYRRIDTLNNNDIRFDYRNVKFRRWQINVTTSDLTGSGNTYSKYSVVLQTGTNDIYLKLDNTPSVPFTTTASWMLFPWSNLQYVSPTNINLNLRGYIIPVSANYMDYTMFSTEPTTNGVQCNYDFIFENKIKGTYNITYNNSDIISNSNTVFFGSHFAGNTIEDYFSSNTIGDYFYINTIGYNFNSKIIGNNFYSNTIGNNFDRKIEVDIIGNNFYSNTIGDNFNGNVIGNYFNSNIIGDDFNDNVIGDYFNYNIIGDDFDDNVIGYYFNYNTIEDDFYSNTIEDNFQLNNIEPNFGGIDFTSSTYVYQSYLKYLFTNSANGQYLRYYDSGNTLQIIQANL